MVLHDFVTQVESHASGLSGGLRSEEGVENLADDGLLDADAVVGEFQDNLFVGNGDVEADVWLVWSLLLHRLLDDSIDGVAQQVSKGLAKLIPVSVELDVVWRDVKCDVDGMLGNFFLKIGAQHLLVLI